MDPPVATPGNEGTEEDFFDSWSKPSTPKSSNPGTPRISTPPILGRPASSNSGNSVPSAPSTTPPATTTTPRTLTHSAAARPGRLGAGTSRLNSASSGASTTSAPKKSKLGLGASKAKPVDFAEAERKALEEAERIKQLGYDREREEAEEKARKEAEALRKAQELGSRASVAAAITTTTNSGSKFSATVPDPKKSAAFPRLGFGAVPGAGAAAAVAAAAATSKKSAPVADDAPTTAREKFGSQKAISSDMYFGRNDYDADNVREAQTRLQSFSGATSISSNQYFGREEDEDSLDRGGSEGLLGDGSLSGLEIAAKDAISRVLANPDVQNVGESIRSGALKVRSPNSVSVSMNLNPYLLPQLSDYLASISER